VLLLYVTLSGASDVAQVIVGAFTVVGVIGSLFLSTRALREVQRDRELRQAPFLAFEGGGWSKTVKFVRAGKAIPGINPAYAARMFPNLRPDAESVRLDAPTIEKAHYGRLHNFGSGVALDTHVVWLVEEVVIGQDSFEITDAKRAEPPYSEPLNDLPTDPGHVPAGGAAQLTRLPTLIEKDVDKKISRADGRLRIECTDVAGTSYLFDQAFHLFTGYNETPSWVHVTFSDLLTGPARA
jgi:hypothetical protein